MSSYARHVSRKHTPQSQKADKRQVKNSAGGYAFKLTPQAQLQRFLVLGCEGGTYYSGEHKLAVENAACVEACLDGDPVATVEVIATVSESGRAVKNSPAIFALALAASHTDPRARSHAMSAIPRVCRTGTHLFEFAETVQAQRGWGRSLRRGMAAWYEKKDPRQLMYQLAKYRQRNGWSHKDVLRLAHPKVSDMEAQAALRWAVGASMDERHVKRSPKDAPKEYGNDYTQLALPAYLQAFEELQHAENAAVAAKLISEHRFTHEMVPGNLKMQTSVWEALLPHMPMGALIRNLGKLTAVGVTNQLSTNGLEVAERISNVEALRKARVHPLSVLSALRVYASGHGDKGKLAWVPDPRIVDALNEAFYLAFDAIEPTGKNILLAIDVSPSMTGGYVGVPGITPRAAAAVLAMATARVEKMWGIVGFTHELTPLRITPKSRLDEAIEAMNGLPWGGTDCAQPMLWALKNKIEVDMFHVYTDNETWSGGMHPHQALLEYRNKTGRRSRFAAVGMTATSFSIAEPSDPGMMDFVGMDTSTPQALAAFAAMG